MNTTKKKGRWLPWFILIILVALVYFMLVRPFVNEYKCSTSKDGETVWVEVDKGMSIKQVAKILKENNLVDTKLAVILKYKNNSEKYGDIHFGTHPLHKGMCIDDMLYELASPAKSADTITITVPEGFSAEMIGNRLEKEGICSKDEFIKALDEDYNYDFIKEIPKGDYKYKLEGFLFPSTYEFFKGITPHQIVDKMLATFYNVYNENFDNYDNLFKVVTLASIVEREAVIDSERAKIAGVIENRLRDNMLLQVDATVVYAKSAGLYDMTKVMYEDLKADSPYNTYKNKGLTPGPICNPGIKSIRASKNPEKHSYFYYHTDEKKKDGSHIFTKTYDEHLLTQ